MPHCFQYLVNVVYFIIYPLFLHVETIDFPNQYFNLCYYFMIMRDY